MFHKTDVIIGYVFFFQNNGSILQVHYGRKYLLRLINANAYNCPILLSISGHDFRVLAADGNPVEPTVGRHIFLFPGMQAILLAYTVCFVHSAHVIYDRCTYMSDIQNSSAEILYLNLAPRFFVYTIALRI